MGRACIWVVSLKYQKCWRTSKLPGIITQRIRDGKTPVFFLFFLHFFSAFTMLKKQFSIVNHYSRFLHTHFWLFLFFCFFFAFSQLRNQVQSHQVYWDHWARFGCRIGEWSGWRSLRLPFGRLLIVQLQHHRRCTQVNKITYIIRYVVNNIIFLRKYSKTHFVFIQLSDALRRTKATIIRKSTRTGVTNLKNTKPLWNRGKRNRR